MGEGTTIMKSTMYKPALILLLAASSASVWARPDSTNRVTIGVMRFGYNIQADFSYGVPNTGAAPQTTPDGDLYNYDDGYVLTDVSTNAGGQTWYWGYDSGAQQVGNEILMSTTIPGGSSGGKEMDASSPIAGFDLTYSRGYILGEDLQFGFDFTLGVLPMFFDNTAQVSSTAMKTTDAYAFSSGVTPPSAPYQGTYNGPGVLINAAPSSTSTTMVPGTSIMGHSSLDATLWALRIGPYVEFPVTEELSVGLAGGVSLGWLNVDTKWNLTGAVNDSGSDSDRKRSPVPIWAEGCSGA